MHGCVPRRSCHLLEELVIRDLVLSYRRHEFVDDVLHALDVFRNVIHDSSVSLEAILLNASSLLEVGRRQGSEVALGLGTAVDLGSRLVLLLERGERTLHSRHGRDSGLSGLGFRH